jgi:tungstate transport system substrate-binding protein
MPTIRNKQFRYTYLRITVLIVLFSGVILISCSGEVENDNSAASNQSLPSNEIVILATTTSTQDSGLLDELVPVFENESGYVVKVIAVGTGQALTMGTRGDADALFVHAPEAEMVLVENGDAINRQLVMHNDFIFVGPEDDPAGIKYATSPEEVLGLISSTGSLFISRGDDSGTHKLEKTLWQKSDIVSEGAWYLESGQGMAATLRIASEKNGYSLTDRATYLVLQQTLHSHILFENSPDLVNIYHAMQVNPEKWPAANEDGARAWIDFLTSDQVQQLIGQFRVSELGQQLFYPDAGKDESELLRGD